MCTLNNLYKNVSGVKKVKIKIKKACIFKKCVYTIYTHIYRYMGTQTYIQTSMYICMYNICICIY